MERREFFKAAGAGALAFGALAQGQGANQDTTSQNRPSTGKSAAGLVVPKYDKLRVAFIGVGARGSGHVSQMLMMEGVEVTAICDLYQDWADRAAKYCTDKGRNKPALYTNGPEDYKRMLDRNDIDIVIIATPWALHVPMCVAAMKRGKHAFVEVPASTTVDGCWELVDTSEKTQKHCMMMENVNYGREELALLNMIRQGIFGEILHGEAAYIHDLRWQMNEIDRGTGSWRTLEYTKRNGNLYPTHGLGPIAQMMNINRGDRLDYLCSVSSPSRARAAWAKEHFPEGHARRKLKFVCGDINTTIAKTVKGATMMIQWDEQLPRPYTRHNFIQGTKGAFGGFPNRFVLEGKAKDTESWEEGEGLEKLLKEYEHPLYKRVGEEAKRAGGHGGMDFIMLWRIVYCLRNGLPLDQDVYDGAVWSAVGALSEISVANRGRSIDVPDFTRGKWKKMAPFPIVS